MITNFISRNLKTRYTNISNMSRIASWLSTGINSRHLNRTKTWATIMTATLVMLIKRIPYIQDISIYFSLLTRYMNGIRHKVVMI